MGRCASHRLAMYQATNPGTANPSAFTAETIRLGQLTYPVETFEFIRRLDNAANTKSQNQQPLTKRSTRMSQRIAPGLGVDESLRNVPICVDPPVAQERPVRSAEFDLF